MIHNSLNIIACSSPKDAADKGFTYRAPEFKGISIEAVVVVAGGTESGRSTVDLILKDPATGQKYVAMVTGRLLKAIPCGD